MSQETVSERKYPSLEEMTFTSKAKVATDRPERYAKQLASHLGHKITVTEIPAGYRLLFNRDGNFSGYGDLIVADSMLEMTVYAQNPESAEKVAGVLDRHLVRFGERDELVVEFSEPSLISAQ